tara:strand:- start:241 stop:507 length:267 start_codon:yes stop_codon:yes gene_type:complete
MKNKSTAVSLAILLGAFGVHRFYLGEYGKGILCILFMPISFFVAPLIGITWLLQSNETFDNKFNKQRIQRTQIEIQKETLKAIQNQTK